MKINIYCEDVDLPQYPVQRNYYIEMDFYNNVAKKDIKVVVYHTTYKTTVSKALDVIMLMPELSKYEDIKKELGRNGLDTTSLWNYKNLKAAQ